MPPSSSSAGHAGLEFCPECNNYMSNFSIAGGNKVVISCRHCSTSKEVDASTPIYVRPDPARARELLRTNNPYIGQNPRLPVQPGRTCPSCDSTVRKLYLDDTYAVSLACTNLSCGKITPVERPTATGGH